MRCAIMNSVMGNYWTLVKHISKTFNPVFLKGFLSRKPLRYWSFYENCYLHTRPARNRNENLIGRRVKCVKSKWERLKWKRESKTVNRMKRVWKIIRETERSLWISPNAWSVHGADSKMRICYIRCTQCGLFYIVELYIIEIHLWFESDKHFL